MENAKTKAKPLAKTEDYLMLCLLVICCLAVPRAYVTQHTSLLSALTYHFTHANAWHVALNFLFLLRYKPRWKRALSGWLCAVTDCRMHDAHVRAVRHLLRDDSAQRCVVRQA